MLHPFQGTKLHPFGFRTGLLDPALDDDLVEVAINPAIIRQARSTSCGER